MEGDLDEVEVVSEESPQYCEQTYDDYLSACFTLALLSLKGEEIAEKSFAL
jgi:hypothetical protein